jgi:hypothetical protein
MNLLLNAMACLIAEVNYIFYSETKMCLIVLNACGYNSCINYVIIHV